MFRSHLYDQFGRAEGRSTTRKPLAARRIRLRNAGCWKLVFLHPHVEHTPGLLCQILRPYAGINRERGIESFSDESNHASLEAGD
jgi:hypothetical protein